MKVKLQCPTCLKEGINTLNGVDVTNTGITQMKCDAGHETTIAIHAERYELLFDSGAWSLHDGYAREAVASFAVAVERFYEFVVRVIAYNKGISFEGMDATWDAMPHSNMQVGAFRFAFLIGFQRIPPKMSSKDNKFRDIVVHEGVFPTTRQATDYGERCRLHIMEIGTLLRQEYHDEMDALVHRGDEARQAKIPKDAKQLHSFHNSVIDTWHLPSLGTPNRRTVTLDEWLAKQAESKRSHERWLEIRMKQRILKELEGAT